MLRQQKVSCYNDSLNNNSNFKSPKGVTTADAVTKRQRTDLEARAKETKAAQDQNQKLINLFDSTKREIDNFYHQQEVILKQRQEHLSNRDLRETTVTTINNNSFNTVS